jgi:hypothetical protein
MIFKKSMPDSLFSTDDVDVEWYLPVVQVPAEGIMEAARVVKFCMENAVKLRQGYTCGNSE